jgi:hypothetical protein
MNLNGTSSENRHLIFVVVSPRGTSRHHHPTLVSAQPSFLLPSSQSRFATI